jgi:hypothetical protein
MISVLEFNSLVFLFESTKRCFKRSKKRHTDECKKNSNKYKNLLAEDEKEKFQTSSLYSETFKRFEFQPSTNITKTPSPFKEDSSKDQKLHVNLSFLFLFLKRRSNFKKILKRRLSIPKSSNPKRELLNYRKKTKKCPREQRTKSTSNFGIKRRLFPFQNILNSRVILFTQTESDTI